MAYNHSNFTFSYGNNQGASGWEYTTADNISTVETSGYFSSNDNYVRAGDLIMVTANDDSRVYLAISPEQYRIIASGVNSFSPGIWANI